MAYREHIPAGGPLDIEQYLRFEAASPTKHEYVDGEIYAMSGVTRRHAQLVMNIALKLGNAARGGACQIIIVDVKVRVGDERVYYPDVMVVCTPGNADDVVVTDPCLLVEVTSPSTARVDRGEKRQAYQTLASLQGYLVVDHRGRRVDWYARADSGAWKDVQVFGEGSVALPCPEAELTLDEIYEGVEFPPAVREPEAEYATESDAV
jgi:Uma2 family endonuclease